MLAPLFAFAADSSAPPWQRPARFAPHSAAADPASPAASPIHTEAVPNYFLENGTVCTATVSVRIMKVKRLPGRAGNRSFVRAKTPKGPLVWTEGELDNAHLLVWPEGLTPPPGEEPEIFSDLAGRCGLVWKSAGVQTIFKGESRLDAVSHFPNDQRLVILRTPLNASVSFLDLLSLDTQQTVKSFELNKDEMWTHVCWLDHDRVLLSFEGRVDCAYAIYNISLGAYEVPRQSRIEGTFALRGDTPWCFYTNKKRGEAILEEQVWPRPIAK